MPAGNRFTIYDAMEHRGDFRKNPANVGARDDDGTALFTGPIAFPKMLYHPEGKTKVTEPGEEVFTPFGPKVLNRKEEIISVVVKNAQEEKKYLDLGWHRHPAKAIEAGGGEAPDTGAEEHIDRLNAELNDLRAEIKRREEERSTEGLSGSASEPRKNLTLGLIRPPEA